MVRNIFTAGCLMATIFLGGFSVACAEDAPRIVQTIPLYEALLKFPVPIWIKNKDQMGDFKTSQHQEKNSFTLEQIPKAQEFADWSNLYGVYAWYLPGYDLKRFVSESVNALALGCKSQPRFIPYETTNDSLIMTYHCPQLVDQLVQNDKNVESGFLFMGQVNHTFVKVYQAWRGTVDDAKSTMWPSDEQVLLDAIAHMKSISLKRR